MKPEIPYLVLTGILVATQVQAGSIRVSGDTIAVRAQGVPLGQLLQELGTIVPLDVVAVDPQLPSRLVDVSLDDVSLDQAAGSILLEVDCSFIVGGLKGQPLRVILGSSDPALLARPASGSQASGKGGAERPATPEEAQARYEEWRHEEDARTQAHEAEMTAISDAQREAEQVPVEIWEDPHVPGGYTMVGENVTYHDPNFVPFKNRPEVRARRLATDVSKIP